MISHNIFNSKQWRASKWQLTWLCQTLIFNQWLLLNYDHVKKNLVVDIIFMVNINISTLVYFCLTFPFNLQTLIQFFLIFFKFQQQCISFSRFTKRCHVNSQRNNGYCCGSWGRAGEKLWDIVIIFSAFVFTELFKILFMQYTNSRNSSSESLSI